jgi:hypothetical protein
MRQGALNKLAGHESGFRFIGVLMDVRGRVEEFMQRSADKFWGIFLYRHVAIYLRVYRYTSYSVGISAISGLWRLTNTVLMASASNACIVVLSSAAMILRAVWTSGAK